MSVIPLYVMNIEVRDAALEARLQKQLQATGSGSVEEVLLRLLETQEEQDRWLLENREANRRKDSPGHRATRPGRGIPEDRVDGVRGCRNGSARLPVVPYVSPK
ncbi:MAG TPA: hypothetical protein VF953_00845 [Terriglobales bacterium]